MDIITQGPLIGGYIVFADSESAKRSDDRVNIL